MLEDKNRLDGLNYEDYPDVWDPEPRVDRDVVSSPSGQAGQAPDIEWSHHHRVARPQQYRAPYYYHQQHAANRNEIADRRQASVLSGRYKKTGSFYQGDFRHGQDTSAACGSPSNGGCFLLLRNRQSIALELVTVTPPHSESYNCIIRGMYNVHNYVIEGYI